MSNAILSPGIPYAPSNDSRSGKTASSDDASAQAVTVVLPFFNEEAFLPATLSSLVNQHSPPAALLLVDNGSSDASVEVCRSVLKRHPQICSEILSEARPGKAYALQAGLARVRTGFIAICDADTFYPPHYFGAAARMFAEGDERLVAVLAIGVNDRPPGLQSSLVRLKGSAVSRLLSRQCHSGGFGHVFRTWALRAAGGFDAQQWPYVLEDHEVMHRVLKIGVSRCDFNFWCQPSDRREDRSRVSWNVAERLLYHCTPFRLKDWYFYEFLGPRFARRGLKNVNLREKPWSMKSGALGA